MLKLLLQVNAVSCGVFGTLFVAAPDYVSQFLGSVPPLLLSGSGLVLLVNAVLLLSVARQARPARLMVLFFSLGDGLWVVASAILLVLGLWITTLPGVVWTLAVALLVGGLGLGQLILLPKKAGGK